MTREAISSGHDPRLAERGAPDVAVEHVAQLEIAVRGGDRHVAEHARGALAVARDDGPDGLPQVVVDHPPAHQHHLARDAAEQHVVAERVVDPVLDVAPARLHVPVGDLVAARPRRWRCG